MLLNEFIGPDMLYELCVRENPGSINEIIEKYIRCLENIDIGGEKDKFIVSSLIYLTKNNVIVESAEIGQINNETDFSYSYLSVYFPLKCLGTVESKLESEYESENEKTGSELEIYICDFGQEKKFRKDELTVGKDCILYNDRKCLLRYRDDKTKTVRFMMVRFPTESLLELNDGVSAELANEYVSIQLLYHIPGNNFIHLISFFRNVISLCGDNIRR